MYYKIVEISTQEPDKHTYFLVRFWRSKADADAGQDPARVNDFLMQLRDKGERIVTDRDGNLKREDGVFVAPADVVGDEKWERETFTFDLPAIIAKNIEAYWQRAEASGYPGHHESADIARTTDDPHKILARSDVQAIKDIGVEKP